jgi:hypothetical protein
MNHFERLTGFERSWADAMVGSFAPTTGAGLAPALGEVDYVSAFELMCRSTTRLAAFGMRLALWMSVIAPVFVWGRATTALALSSERRAVLLGEMLTHRFMIVRELTVLLKLCASFAIFRVAALRARSHYDDAQLERVERATPASQLLSDAHDDLEDSGERVRLPLLGSAIASKKAVA